jgi:hypothetical protein
LPRTHCSTHRRGNPTDFRQSPAAVHLAEERAESGIRSTDRARGAERATIAIAPLLGGSFESQTCEKLVIKQNCFHARWKSTKQAGTLVDDLAVVRSK